MCVCVCVYRTVAVGTASTGLPQVVTLSSAPLYSLRMSLSTHSTMEGKNSVPQ